MKELQNLIDAAKGASHTLRAQRHGIVSPDLDEKIADALDAATSAAENSENAALRLAEELADMVLSHIEGGLVYVPTVAQYVAMESKARELQKELGG